MLNPSATKVPWMEGYSLDLTIIIDALRARTTDEFLIRDVPGTSGRLDVVCRILISAYRSVPELSASIHVNAVLGGPPNPPLLLQVDNVMPGGFPESELECALIIKGLLYRHRTKGIQHNPHWPQFTLNTRDFCKTMHDVISNKTQILYLVETGKPLQQVQLDLNQPIVLILGDDQGLSPEHEKEVYSLPIQETSIGTRSLLGSQVISLVLVELMRRYETK
jgi:tRNA (pseudouridine54-N1)-methyltransferase